jgi:hypothetical protein
MAKESRRQFRKLVNSAIRRSSPGRESTTATESTGESDAPSREAVEGSIASLDEKLVAGAGGRDKLTDADQKVLDLSRRAAEKLLSEGAEASLTPAEETALEAVAMADGSRPALLIKNDGIDPADPLADIWADELTRYESPIRAVAPSVGRVDSNGRHVGTGWMIRPGYVVTNRHVAQILAVDPAVQLLKLEPSRNATICFGYEAGAGPQRPQFAVKEITFCGEQYIASRNVNMACLDMAILKLDPVDEEQWPSQLPSAYLQTADVTIGKDIYALGYPGNTAGSRLPQETLLKLFGDLESVKRFSPGEISGAIGGVEGDTPKRTIAHDATTLGGSSGSVLLAFDDSRKARLAGLHFGGYEVRYGPGGVEEYRGRNYAHCFAAMSDVLRTVDNTIAADREKKV